jgi:hypothetical protein
MLEFNELVSVAGSFSQRHGPWPHPHVPATILSIAFRRKRVPNSRIFRASTCSPGATAGLPAMIRCNAQALLGEPAVAPEAARLFRTRSLAQSIDHDRLLRIVHVLESAEWAASIDTRVSIRLKQHGTADRQGDRNRCVGGGCYLELLGAGNRSQRGSTTTSFTG